MDGRELGRVLQRRRAAAGWTIATVAAKAGLSVPYIANLEKGRGNPTLAALSRLTAALGLSLGVTDPTADPTAKSTGTDTRLDTTSPNAIDRLVDSPRARSGVTAIANAGGSGAGRSATAVTSGLRAALLGIQEVTGSPPTERDLDRVIDVCRLARRG